MKHWFFYIRVPKTKVNRIPILKALVNPVDSGIHMRSQYDAFARKYTYTLDLDESEDGKFLYGLYAWCSSKELARLFRASRSDKYFTCKKMDIPSNSIEWEALHSKYSSHELIHAGYSDDNGRDYLIPMTHFESDVLSDNSSDIIEIITNAFVAERYMKRKADDDFRVVLDIFDPNLIKALELLSWSELIVEYGFLDCEVCMLGRAGDDPDYLIDQYYQASSYEHGICGYEVAKREIDPITTYIFMLGDMLQ